MPLINLMSVVRRVVAHLLDVRSFRDSTAKRSVPKNSSLHGGPDDDTSLQQIRRCRAAVSLLSSGLALQQSWRSLRAAPAVLLCAHILT